MNTPFRTRRLFLVPVAALATSIPLPLFGWDTPGSDTIGLTWSSKHYVWVASDQDTNKIWYTGHLNDTWHEFPDWSGKPGPLAMVDDVLWVVKEEDKVLVRYDLATNPVTRTTVQIPSEALREVHAITGLAWDGSSLWIATGCGLCSSLIQFNVDQKKVTRYLFPRCEPRGLMFRPGSGNRPDELTTVAYSGPYLNSYFSTWDLSGNVPAAGSTQEFKTFGSGVTPPTDPTAVGFRNGQYWVVDRATNTISQYYLGDMP